MTSADAPAADWLQGLFSALVTPFVKKTEALDEVAFRRLVQEVAPHVDGLVTSGSTGEFSSLTREERRRLLEIAIAEGGGRPVIAGCGAPSTSEALALARDAREAGASAALVVTPYFLHPSDKGIYQHFYEIANGVDLPLVLYNIPSLVGRELPRQVIEDLADLPNVVGLKDSSGQLAYLLEVLEYAGDRIELLCGHDEVVVPALAAGAGGLILGSAQVYPEVWAEVLHLARNGRFEAARERQRTVQKLSRIFARHGGGVAVKAALRMLDLNMGPPRAPLKAVGGLLLHETRAEIQLELEKLGRLSPSKTPLAWPSGPLEERFGDLEIQPAMLVEHALRVGSGAAGDGVERACIDLIAGAKTTPLGDAWALQLTYPLTGREALTTILEPGLAVRPSTLLLPTLPQHNLRQANMIYGPAQSALAQAIVDALRSGLIPSVAVERDVMVALVTIHPHALNRHVLASNVRAAAAQAIEQAYGSASD